MLTKDKRNELIGSILTLTMATTLTAGCSNEEEQAAEEWNNSNSTANQQESDNSSFWNMVTAFGLGYALSNLWNSQQQTPPPPKQPPAYSSTPDPANSKNVNDKAGTSAVNKAPQEPVKSKVAAPSGSKTGIGSSSIRSHAIS